MTAEQMKARIAELEAELSMHKDIHAKFVRALHVQFESVSAERDALKVDAERYRWLRDDTSEMPDGQRELYVVAHGLPFTDDGDEDLFGVALDAAIDAAMKPKESGQ